MKKFFGILICTLALCSSASADRLDEMISPASNPVNFDDPRANTELRAIYMYHKLDKDFITGGGDIRLYALELRYALNDRLALLATKDGFVDFNPDGTLNDESGFANIAVGAKYAFYKDGDTGRIATAGLRYEIPMGEKEVFQGEGDGFFQPFFTAASALGDSSNIISAFGFRLPVNDKDSSFFDFDIHLDTKIPVGEMALYPLVELNVIHVLDGGERLGIADEGMDLISFGATNAGGETIVTAGAGARFRLNESVDFGLVYQFPLSSGTGSNIIDWRVTADMIFSFDL